MFFKVYFYDTNKRTRGTGIILNIEASYQEVDKIYENLKSGWDMSESDDPRMDKYSMDDISMKHYEKFLKSLEENHIRYSKLENAEILIF